MRNMRSVLALMIGACVVLGGCSTPGQEVVVEESESSEEPVAEAVSDIQQESDEIVFEFDGEIYEGTWTESPDGAFEILLPKDVPLLDVHIKDDGQVDIWNHEREHLADHTDNPDEVELRGRIVLTSKTIEDRLERSNYRELFAQSLSSSLIFEEDSRFGEGRTYGGMEGGFREQRWRFPQERGRSYRNVEWTTMRWVIERDETVWNFVLIAPETQAEFFGSLFLQALETVREGARGDL